MRHLFLLLFVVVAATNLATSQGCVAVRNITGFGQYNLTDNAFSSAAWLVSVNNRYFKAHRDFLGSQDQKTPEERQAINHTFTTDIMVGRLLNKGWSLSFDLPIAANKRSSVGEHGGVRHSTRSFGIGDVRFTVYKWVLQPTVRQKGNLQLGLGIKLPTGDYKVQDYFHLNDSTKVLSAVNPSIQLGDGGTGITTELNGFYKFNENFILYGNLFYLINPREQNGTQYTTGRTPSPVAVKSGAVELSVPDQYSIRAGTYFSLSDFSFSVGIREEGIPVYDLFGGSNGTRRAGHNFSVEPGVIYKIKNASVYSFVPIIVDRGTKQNVPDKKATELTGVYTFRPGGFADFQVFLGVLFKL